MRAKIILVFLAIGFCVGLASAQPARSQGMDGIQYLPVILNKLRADSIFGVETIPGVDLKVTASTKASGALWLRQNGLLWSQVQPTSELDWKWENVSGLENSLVQASDSGLKVTLTIRGTPGWAQKIPGKYCGPVREDKLAAFANFVQAAVQRYSVPPYRVKYFEIWNEPDVDPGLVSDNSVFGCWGDQADPFYGGGYYATMLKQVYPAIKAVDNSVQVMIGGLLLDCDSTSTGGAGSCPAGRENAPKFFEGVLANGGGDYFDIANYHAYVYYDSLLSSIILADLNNPTWAGRGGVIAGKAAFLAEKMAAYHVSKPIFQSEAGLLLYSGDSTPAFETAKANYLVWQYARALSQRLMGVVWYTLDGPGWKNAGLLDSNQDPRPAFQAYQFMASELADATYADDILAYPGLTGFRFKKGGMEIWLLFPLDSITHSITVPSGTQAILDINGSPIALSNGMLPVNAPIYIEVAQ